MSALPPAPAGILWQIPADPTARVQDPWRMGELRTSGRCGQLVSFQ